MPPPSSCPPTPSGKRLPATADWRRLLELKVEWGVSLAALLMRAKTLGILSQHRYIGAVKQMSARGWRRAEPGDNQLGPPEQPRLLALAAKQLRLTGLPLEHLATEAGLPPGLLEQLLQQTTDKRPRLDL